VFLDTCQGDSFTRFLFVFAYFCALHCSSKVFHLNIFPSLINTLTKLIRYFLIDLNGSFFNGF